MPRNPDIKKVLMIGSGPIVIGQAAEFDYAGTQACRSLKEEGIEVVLLNSNPAMRWPVCLRRKWGRYRQTAAVRPPSSGREGFGAYRGHAPFF